MDSLLEAGLFRGIWLGGSVYEDRGRTHWEGISSLRLWLLAFTWEGNLGDVASWEVRSSVHGWALATWHQQCVLVTLSAENNGIAAQV